MKWKQGIGSVVAAVAVAGTGVGVAAGAGQTIQACVIRVDVPNEANNAYVGRSGCSNTLWGTGYIKEDRDFWADDIVGSKSFYAGLYYLNGSCGNGVGSYYSEFNSSSGAQAKSSTSVNCD